ncbi:hypothetical protein F6A13_08185 [Acidithiobacillus sp. 'AMD consortium']|jgi:hypothetical protein|uniref:TubC N-terminal docking domain-containing protein n=2 Tax=Acidithiobacillus ferridurans TaxID=1232575 RepID=A0A8X8G987_ACIFI|nr:MULTISPECIES: hypothetical protein [Acidithiobacillus]MBU2715193.1 hypothetical protein [Acidithiobacillus ferridurans]MBU2721996.1 hypothetical protein [Acidithiobacillus ferridurans]MBU2727486.1 hypothetical protein [Acidithiobacillus ferridurans]QFG78622.1 hypothetical protein F6A13_08185 [Acidithiobacillus sp. 'AMD consortium']BBF66703.1 hypothetical protein AFERRID_29210 [Acidithiobacillus ferridurans]
MSAKKLLIEITKAGGTIAAEGDKLKFQGIPARLVHIIKQNKAELLAELQKVNVVNMVNIDSGYLPPARIVCDAEPMFTPLPSDQCVDDYAMAERLAIQAESSLGEDPGDVPGFADMTELTPEQHGAILHRLMNAAPAMSTTDTTPADTMQPTPAMAPQRVSCGQCCRFQPGPQPLSIGRCLATVDGQPPAGNRGDYRAAFPTAPRQCPEFSGVQS